MASPKRKEDSDWFSWALIVFLFLVELWPIALILLLAKLFGKDRNKELPPEKSPSQARAAAKRVTRSPIPKKSTARWLRDHRRPGCGGGRSGSPGPTGCALLLLRLDRFLAGGLLSRPCHGRGWYCDAGQGIFHGPPAGALFQVSGSTWRPGRHAGGRTGEDPGLSGAPANRAGFTADD